jgi:hypothetical protein
VCDWWWSRECAGGAVRRRISVGGAMTSTIELGLVVGGLAPTAIEEIGGDSELDGGW